MSNPFFSSLEILTSRKAHGHRALQEELVVMRTALKKSMDAGLPVDQMTTARSLMQAVDAASTAVDKMHTQLCP